MTDKTFLDKAYALEGAAETRALYNDWSASYDAEVGANGYATPGRVARALVGVVSDPDTPILDYGCGTGVSGMALRAAGLGVVDGMDPSPEMLKGAAEKNAYRSLTLLDLDAPPPVAKGDYSVIAAIGVIGVIGTGAAPAPLFDVLLDLLPSGGYFALSLNDHALADASFNVKIPQAVQTGAAKVVFEEYGDHLPGVGLNSSVYILRKP